MRPVMLERAASVGQFQIDDLNKVEASNAVNGWNVAVQERRPMMRWPGRSVPLFFFFVVIISASACFFLPSCTVAALQRRVPTVWWSRKWRRRSFVLLIVLIQVL